MSADVQRNQLSDLGQTAVRQAEESAIRARQSASTLPVCIIGAGSSGITTAKALKQKGIAFDCFEKGSDLGGMWRYENDNGMSSAYRSLHIDTSRKNLGYPDFPIGDDQPDFFSHRDMIAYLEAYADRFDVRRHIVFGTEVTEASPAADGTWNVRLSTGESKRYRGILVANGHLWNPRMPEFPGQFDGVAIHSHDYRTATPFEDKDVLVVGIGNSAVDIAVDLCRRARSVHLSTRRSAWIMPKYIMGIPTDRWSAFLSRKLKLPTRISRSILGRIMLLAVGRQERFGMPKPKHAIWREHATISQELLPCLGHGWIRMKPNIRVLRGDDIEFEDGSSKRFDAIIYATGYRATFPFLQSSVFEVKDGDVYLYRRIVDPRHAGLYFLGLVQPIGPTIPLVEIQARWLAAVLAREIALPDDRAMKNEIEQHQRALKQRYVDSARYTLEVDYRDYSKQLVRDLKRGKAGV